MLLHFKIAFNLNESMNLKINKINKTLIIYIFIQIILLDFHTLFNDENIYLIAID